MPENDEGEKSGIRIVNSDRVRVRGNVISGFKTAISIDNVRDLDLVKNILIDYPDIDPLLFQRTFEEIRKIQKNIAEVSEEDIINTSKKTGLWDALAKISDVATIVPAIKSLIYSFINSAS